MAKSWQVWRSSLFILGIILAVAAALRLYRINDVPSGLTTDEAAIAYNAWSIGLWGRDEWGVQWPLTFRSFGDYKAPLLIYVMAIPYRLFGLHPEWLRLFIAGCGVVTVGMMYRLGVVFWGNEKQHWALVAALLMAISPWGLQYSRLGFEATLGLFLVVAGIACLLEQRIAWGVGCLTLSLYAYHSPKMVVPLLLALLIPFLKKRWWYVVVSMSILVTPLLLTSLGSSRANTLIFFSESGQFFSTLLRAIGSHLDLAFWVGGKDSIGLTHGVPGFGVLLWPELLFFLIGLGTLVWRRQKKDWLLVGWVVAGLLPSVLSIDSPHSLRALLALPAVILITASGIQVVPRWGRILALVVWIVNLGLYLTTYYGTYSANSALAFRYGYKEAMEYVIREGRRADHIVMTDAYEQPYIYTLLYRGITPKEYLSGGLANMSFRPIRWPEQRSRTVYIGTPAEIPVNDPAVIGVVRVPETQQVVFVAAETP